MKNKLPDNDGRRNKILCNNYDGHTLDIYFMVKAILS